MQYDIVDLPTSEIIDEHNAFFEAYTEWLMQADDSDEPGSSYFEVKLKGNPRTFKLNLFTLSHLGNEFFNLSRLSEQSPIQYLVNTYLLDADIIRAVDYDIVVDATANVVRLVVPHLDMTYTLENFNTLQRLFLARITSQYGVKAKVKELKVNQLTSYTYRHTATYAEFIPLESDKDE